MKPKIILSVAVFCCFAPTIFSQSSSSLSAGFGIIQSYGTALGFEIGFKRAINENLRFQLTTGYFHWGEKHDLNNGYSYSNYYYHVIREMGLLVPLRVGISYKFGNADSHPYLSIEWAANYVTNDYYTNVFAADAATSFDGSYKKYTKNTVFVSIGFSMGYSFCISDNFNLVSGVNWQTGDFTQLVGFVSGIEYKL
ncbi:MAG: hypothetical protein NTX65_11055 [Ignavibacteriales bacterium]|nr:hypothetical protein [Ignavibacteriales bacterium]